MSKYDECKKSFDINKFTILKDELEDTGYLIDGDNNLFSSTQLESMDQEIFHFLADKFNIVLSDINISKISNYFPLKGSFYMVFNENIISENQAKQIFSDFVKKQPTI